MDSPASTAAPGADVGASPAARGRRLVGYGISLLATLGILVAAGDVVSSQYPALMRAGVALCLGAQVLVIVACLRRSRLMWSITAMAVAGILAITVGLLLAPAPWSNLEWRTNIWLGPVMQYLILLHPRRWGWPLLSVVSLGCWSVVTVVHDLDWRIQVVDLAFTLTPIATLGIGGAAITTILTELRASQLRRIEDEQEARRTAMREQERRTRIRLAHDSLLHTLQQVSRGWAPPSASEVRMLAVGTTMELRSSSNSLQDSHWAPLRPALEAALDSQGCEIVWVGDAVLAPANSSEAIVGAAREAVRNVRKHADGTAVITISRMGRGCRVTIADEGPGFDPSSLPPGHIGVAEGIIARMAEVGGQATITSDSSGTTVTLDWAADPVERAEPFGPMARALISWLPVPVLVASLVHVLVLDVGPSAIGVALIWGSAAAVTLLGMRRLRAAPYDWWQPLVLTALSMAVLVANYLWISPVGTNGYDVWTPSLAGAMMVLALPGRRLWQAVAMAAAVIGVAVASSGLALGWETAMGSQFGSIMAVVMYVLAPLALATGASILATFSRRTEELHAAQRLTEELHTERDAIRREWVTRMQRLSEPFLMELAHGVLDPASQEAVRRARILEARLRDELSLWPHGTGITDRAHDLREQGWTCTLDVSEANEEVRRTLLALMAPLPPPVPGQHLHVTHRHSAAVATITNPPLTPQQWRELGQDMESVQDEDFTQLRMRTATMQHRPRAKESR